MKKITVFQICFIAFCTVINLAGGSIALMLKLPVYLDCIGTLLTAALLGPVYGVLPGILSGIISGMSTDVYAFYYIPVQIITGLMAGIVFKTSWVKKWKTPLGTLFISLPGTAVSAGITAYLFGGVTSSGSSILVAVLNKLGMNLVLSVFAVQALTDYLDRFFAVGITAAVLALMTNSMKMQIKIGHNGTM